MQTQNERLLNYLERHGEIDPLRAWSELGIYRLGACWKWPEPQQLELF